MTKPLTIQLVLYPGNRGWIIEKFATRLAEHLPQHHIQAEISDQPSANADINHWMIYHHCQGERLTPGTVWITHVDDYEKLRQVRQSLTIADVAICLSRMTVDDLAKQGIPRQRLCYITPAHDGLIRPRRIVIGITTNVYDDHRKREDLLAQVAREMRLDMFHFEILGQGWELIIPQLEAAGATVRYYSSSMDYRQGYQAHLERIPTFDYYLYTGLDEGSLGTLDALAAGAATIITPQGFHLDIEGGLTHPFWDAAQLREVFTHIARERQRRVESVKHLTWSEYARQHAAVWRALLEGHADQIESLLHPQSARALASPRAPLLASWKDRIGYYGKPVLRRLSALVKRQSPR